MRPKEISDSKVICLQGWGKKVICDRGIRIPVGQNESDHNGENEKNV